MGSAVARRAPMPDLRVPGILLIRSLSPICSHQDTDVLVGFAGYSMLRRCRTCAFESLRLDYVPTYNSVPCFARLAMPTATAAQTARLLKIWRMSLCPCGVERLFPLSFFFPWLCTLWVLTRKEQNKRFKCVNWGFIISFLCEAEFLLYFPIQLKFNLDKGC